MQPVLIRFEPAMLARLTTLAERNGISLAALVRHIIQEAFDKVDKVRNADSVE